MNAFMPGSLTDDLAAHCNVARRLTCMAKQRPDDLAIAMPLRRKRQQVDYRTVSFHALDDDSTRIAAALQRMGMQPGMRVVLLVRPSIDFIAAVFAMLKAGLVIVLIDPGMGRRNLVRCLSECEPEGFIAISPVHAVRTLLRRRFAKSKWHVTVGRRWWWGGSTLDALRQQEPGEFASFEASPEDPAAIIFTTGSTGPPKGVLYRHGNFDHQVSQLQEVYQIEPGGIDLPGFPLFGLFNAALGVATVIPEMNPTRPASVDPVKIVQAMQRWKVTQSFGSPAMWNVVGRYCERHEVRIASLRQVFSAGAPVPPHVLLRMKSAIAADGEVYTPYGATEALPVASISASEVLGETQSAANLGEGTCVGRSFPGIEWKVIAIDDGPLATLDKVQELPPREVGELMVSGPVVTTEYVTRREANDLHKVRDGDRIWHRMGDLGYLDEQERFWFCGRKAHRVQTPGGVMYTVPCEAIMNAHPHVYRSALVGVGPVGRQRPVMIVEPWPEHRPQRLREEERLLQELRELAGRHWQTQAIEHFLLHNNLPVDIRHNAKIFREKLRPWAAKRLGWNENGEPIE